MRATGAGKRVVQLPSWVTLHDPSDCPEPLDPEGDPYAACERCGKVVQLIGAKVDASRALGRFATWHRRCPDPALIRRAVEQAKVDKAENDRREEWFRRRREGR